MSFRQVAKLKGANPMADIATITGIVGTITGGIGLIVSLKAHAQISAIKALDLRLELNKTFDNLEVILSGIDGYLDFVYQSHIRVLAATGRLKSGEMELFEEEFGKDKVRLRGLLGTQPRREANYNGQAPSDLEAVIANVHAFYVQVGELRGKYQRLFDSDEEHRKEIRAQHPA